MKAPAPAVGMPLAPYQRLDLACDHYLIRLRVGEQAFVLRNGYNRATTTAINGATEGIVCLLKTHQFCLTPTIAAFAAELQTCQCVAPGKRTILMLKYIPEQVNRIGSIKRVG
jgi:hypothetical protein